MRVECQIVNVPQLSTDTLLQYLQDSSFSSRLQNNLQLGPLQLNISSLNISSKPSISCDLILYIHNPCFCIGGGFCDNEMITSDRRGVYLWSETQVGSTIQNSCVYNNRSIGSRRCVSHLHWEEANLMNCITRDTLKLQLLAKRLAVC